MRLVLIRVMPREASGMACAAYVVADLCVCQQELGSLRVEVEWLRAGGLAQANVRVRVGLRCWWRRTRKRS